MVKVFEQLNADTIRLAESTMANQIIKPYLSKTDNLVVLAGDLNQRHNHRSVRKVTKMNGLHDPIKKEIMVKDKNATTYHSKARERIDYLLISESLDAFYQSESATIHDTEATRIASDHLPVSMEFLLPNEMGAIYC